MSRHYWRVSGWPDQKLTVFFDESTSLSRESCLPVYPRKSVDSSKLLTSLLELHERENTTSDGITSELLNCLLNHGIDGAFLKEVRWDSAQMKPVYQKIKYIECTQNGKVRSQASYTRFVWSIGWNCWYQMKWRLAVSLSCLISCTVC